MNGRELYEQELNRVENGVQKPEAKEDSFERALKAERDRQFGTRDPRDPRD